MIYALILFFFYYILIIKILINQTLDVECSKTVYRQQWSEVKDKRVTQMETQSQRLLDWFKTQ